MCSDKYSVNFSSTTDLEWNFLLPHKFSMISILTCCLSLPVGNPCDRSISHGEIPANRSNLHHWTHHHHILSCWLSPAELQAKSAGDHSHAAVKAWGQLSGEMDGPMSTAAVESTKTLEKFTHTDLGWQMYWRWNKLSYFNIVSWKRCDCFNDLIYYWEY